jgi:enoyl-CoA hydratase/carnithine racemase
VGTRIREANVILPRCRWNERAQNGDGTNEQERLAATIHGFGSISRRYSPKPIIAAVIGGAYGGGMELLVNCDIIIASSDAKFAFPEVKRGVVAILGGMFKNMYGHRTL